MMYVLEPDKAIFSVERISYVLVRADTNLWDRVKLV